MDVAQAFNLLVPFTVPALAIRFLGLQVGLLERFALLLTSYIALRGVRLALLEWDLRRRAAAKGALLAPWGGRGHWPYGIDFVLARLRFIRSGTPLDFRALHYPAVGEPDASVTRVRFLGINQMATLNHSDVQYILATAFKNWGRSPIVKVAMQPILGDGVFNADQPPRGLWAFHRQLTKPHFSRDRVKDLQAMEEHWLRADEYLYTRSKAGDAVDIQDLFFRYTMTVGTQHLFGVCVDALQELVKDGRATKVKDFDPAAFSKDFPEAFNNGLKATMLPPFIAPLRRLLVRKTDPATQRVLYIIDRLVAAGVAEQQGLKEAPTDIEAVVANWKRDEKPEEDQSTLLTHLLTAAEAPSLSLIREECLNILLAARDTTAFLLAAVIYELGLNPEEWDRVREEVVGSFGEGEEASRKERPAEELRSGKRLRAVLNETLRLHPPVFASLRHAFEDDVLPSGYFVPAGTDVRYLIVEFQRNPSVWGADADRFDPKRWIDDRRLAQAKDPFSFQPFSAGPRLCLGQQMAYTEASLVLVRILQRFKAVEVLERSRVGKEMPSVTASFRDGMWVRLIPA